MSTAAANDAAIIFQPPRSPGTFRITGTVTVVWRWKPANTQPPSGVGTSGMVIQTTDTAG